MFPNLNIIIEHGVLMDFKLETSFILLLGIKKFTCKTFEYFDMIHSLLALNLFRVIHGKSCNLRNRVSHSPTFVTNLFRKYLIWSPLILGNAKHNFFSRNEFPKVPSRPPLSLKKWIFKLLRLPCWWYSKLVPWYADRSWKGIDLIRSLSTEKTSKTCQNIRIFVWFDNCWKLQIFLHVLDIFSVLSNQIKSTLFLELSASHSTSLEYHQQGNRSNLKIHSFKSLAPRHFFLQKYVSGVILYTPFT